MPRKRTAEEEIRGEALYAARADLAMYRKVLLEFCDRVRCDIVTLDEARVICREVIVSSRRITRALIGSIFEAAMRDVATMNLSDQRNAFRIFERCKLQFIAHVDKYSFVANVVSRVSSGAKRTKRGDETIVRGGSELVDATTKEICDLYWQRVEERDTLEAEVKAKKRSSSKPTVSTTEMIGKKTTPQVKMQTLPSMPVVVAPEEEKSSAATSTAAATVTITKTSTKKMRSSISKKVAGELLELVAEYVAEIWRGNDDFMPEICKVVDEFWAAL